MDNDALWASLPVPAILVGRNDCILEVNSAGEPFLNASSKSLVGNRLLDRLAIDADIEAAFARVRRDQGPMFINRVDVGAGHAAPIECNIQIAPVIRADGDLLLMMEPRQLADRLGKAHGVKTAARSAIGMAEMLAHEIKNPLAGITGAAQLLSMNLAPEDQELTDLIVVESRRIVALLDQVEQFGNLAPPAAPGGQHPRPARPGAEIRRGGLCRADAADRGLRPVAAADLGRPRPVDAGVPEPAEERRRGGRRRGRHHPDPQLLRPCAAAQAP